MAIICRHLTRVERVARRERSAGLQVGQAAGLLAGQAAGLLAGQAAGLQFKQRCEEANDNHLPLAHAGLAPELWWIPTKKSDKFSFLYLSKHRYTTRDITHLIMLIIYLSIYLFKIPIYNKSIQHFLHEHFKNTFFALT
jgi:hypothetical protein